MPKVDAFLPRLLRLNFHMHVLFTVWLESDAYLHMGYVNMQYTFMRSLRMGASLVNVGISHDWLDMGWTKNQSNMERDVVNFCAWFKNLRPISFF